MRKFSLLTLVFVFACLTSSLIAQINVIPKIGVNAVSLRNDLEDFTFEGSTGFNVGVDLRFGENFIVQPGIHYYNLKTNFEAIGDSPILETGDFNNESIRIPLMIGTGIGTSERFQFRVLVGGVAAFRMKVNSDASNFFDEKDNFKAANFGAIGGIGFDIGDIALDLTYEYGLGDVLENGKGTKNNIASLTVGYIF